MSKAYQRAGGVDLQAGYATVERIKKHVQRTHRPGGYSAAWADLEAFLIWPGWAMKTRCL